MKARIDLRLHNVLNSLEVKEKIITELKILVKSNISLIITYVLVSVFCFAVFVSSIYFKEVIDIFSASTFTLWGIVTSVFVHGGGVNHLTGNLFGLFIWFTLFAITNNSLEFYKRRISTRFFIATIFLAGFVSNLLWIILLPQSYTSGLSGVVYASEGIVLTISLSNTLTFPKMSKPFTKEKKLSFSFWSINFLIFFCIFGSIVSDPGIFLNISPKVNFFVHGISFYIAFAFTLIWNFRKTNLQFTFLTHKQGLSKRP